MTRAEFAAIASAMRTYYPREQIFTTDQALLLWFEQFTELSAAATEKALKHWARNNKWAPSIADLRELAIAYDEGRMLDWNEAQEVRRILDQKKRQEQLEERSKRTAGIIEEKQEENT